MSLHQAKFVSVHNSGAQFIRRMSMETFTVRLYTGSDQDYISVEADKSYTADDVVKLAASKLKLSNSRDYELAEVLSTSGQLCKERRLQDLENPVRIQLLWPKVMNADIDQCRGLYTGYRFFIRKKNLENLNRTSIWQEISEPNPVDNFLTAFLQQPTNNKEYTDLCNLPDLNEKTLLENVKSRFIKANIYTYVGTILIAVNPFKFFPIYNPKYVKMYQKKRLGDLPPHIFAIADAAFYTMLRTKKNQCIVISGESGSGKTESTNLLLHHLTALSHKGLHGSGVEQTILGAGPVLEAFGNAKTVHNNNSSRFGKFILVNYKENGMVHGAIVEKYLLEKSRIVSQAINERNYHVFYYLLEGADDLERKKLYLGKPEDYFYLRQSEMSVCNSLEEVDEANEFSRLKQSMEMVGFSQVTQTRIFGVLSTVLHLGNVKFKKKGDQHHDESVTVINPEEILIVSKLLMVKDRTLLEALTQKKTIAGDETVVMTHRMEHAVATRDAMAKCLYGALFDWIVLKVNQALLAKRHNSEHQDDENSDKSNHVRHTGNSIGVLDIFGFEDFRWNSFEQFCINYANEHLQYYFNQHIFKFEQEEYKKEGIQWKNIEFIDNTGCLELFSKRSNGLFSLLDEECNFPGASNETLLSKFHHHHSKGNVYYEAPQKKEMAFAVLHYAGKVKYQIKDFREKNSDQIRMDIVGNLKSSSLTFVRELMCVDPVAVLRWTIIKTLVKSVFAFINAGKIFKRRGGVDPAVLKERKQASIYLMGELGANLSPHHLSSSQRRSVCFKLHETNQYSRPTSDDLMEEDENAVDDDVDVDSPRDSANLCDSIDLYKEDEAKVMQRAKQVLMRNKYMKPKSKSQTMFSDIKTLKTIANRTIYIGGKVNSKQKPPSVSAQFQWSLSQLMSTLNQANPFFIRCIKSNGEKLPCIFDDVLVLRQLRYTGMLATVRIRQSGYNYRLTFEEFIQIYKILLPRGINSDAKDICRFLKNQKNLNQENYQIGKAKIFLRETEKLYLDECLHCDIMKRVVAIQRWMKTKIENNRFLQMKKNAIIIQKSILCHLARRHVEIVRESVIMIQRNFRGAVVRWKYHHMRQSTIRIQAHIKGHICRKRYQSLKSQLRKQRDDQTNDNKSITSDEGVIRDYSEDEYKHKESEDIPDEPELKARSQKDSISSWPQSSSTTHSPHIQIESLSKRKDDILSVDTARVQNLKQKYVSSDDRDGRSSHGTAGRERAPKMSPAPLAKQESFSDMDSPAKDKISPLSPDKIQPVEEVLKKGQSRRTPDVLNIKDGNQGPLNMVKRFVGSRRKKDCSQDESDDDLDKHLLKTHIKSPVTPLSPKSPKDDNKLIFPSNDEIKSGHKKITNKNTHKVGEKDKENRLAEAGTNWTVSRTTQWQYPEEFVIKETYELQLLDMFISRKINGLIKECNEKMSQFDQVFIKCLKGFHDDLKSTLSVAMQKKNGCDMKYRDLFANFKTIMEATCREDNIAADFPDTLCINAFRGYLDEFRNSVNEKKKDFKAKKKPVRQKREKKKDVIEFQNHKFSQVQFGIPTFCELCSNIIWILEKGHVCQVCKYTCHKKCVFKSTDQCKGVQDTNENITGTRVFGAPLSSLVTKDDKLPVFMEKMIMLIETHGLYTEGIYRKSGSAHKIRMLKIVLDSGITDINIEEYQVHVLTSTLKNFFRELPEPLLTFEFYDEFLQAAEIHDDREAIQVLFSQIEKLPKVNHDVFERLVFHLARVASHETSNKMSVNSLAIIFAPCLLRTNKTLQAQHMLLQVSRQQLCLEKILQEQLCKLKSTLQDINTLEYAEKTTKDRLNVLRASKRSTGVVCLGKNDKDTAASLKVNTLTKQERVLNSHLQALREEKEGLTSSLPVFDRHSSDDEMLSAEDIETIDETADDMEDPEGSVVFNLPGTISGQLVHVTNNHADVSWTQQPLSKYHVEHLDITNECRPLNPENVHFEEMQEQYECDDKKKSVTTLNKLTDTGILNKKSTSVGASNKHELVDAANKEQKVEHYKKYQLSTQTRRLQETSEAKLLNHAISITDHYRKDSFELNKQRGSQFGTTKLKSKAITDSPEPALNTHEYSLKQTLELKKPQIPIYQQFVLTAGSQEESDSMMQISPPKMQSEIDETSPSHNYFLTEGQNETDHTLSFENTNLSLMEIGNDSDEEIMV